MCVGLIVKRSAESENPGFRGEGKQPLCLKISEYLKRNDFEEKLYSVGKIPGSFLKREGRPTDKAILVCRMIDRPIRPLFPKDMRNDVSIVCTVMSVDPDCSPEIAALVGTSVALSISDIPWDGPISGVSVGLIDGEFIINPTAEQRKLSQMAVTVASTDERIAMIEAGANEVSDEDMFNLSLIHI